MSRTATAGNEDASVDDDLPVAPGDVIAGKYRVDDVLGSGGMGVVLGATHLALDERVAIKVLRPRLVRDEDSVARFLREARSTAKLKSPHVARVLDVDRLPDGVPYIVMERLDGRDLEAKLEAEGPRTIDEVVRWMLEACAAVAEAHSLRIVHRDLKPANLFLSERPGSEAQIKVLDFGVSRILDGSDVSRGVDTRAGLVVGTSRYMAPEQHESARKADERSDIWALGVMMFELLTGRVPWDGDSSAVIYAMIVSTEAPSLRAARPEVPPRLAQVVGRCLRRAPEERFESVAALADALESARETTAPAVEEREAATARPPRRRWIVAAAALVMVAGAASLLAWSHASAANANANATATAAATATATGTATATATATAATTATATATANEDVAPTASAPSKPRPAPTVRAARAAGAPTAAPSASTVDDSYRHRTSF